VLKSRLSEYITRLSLLAVYSSFFVVQAFYTSGNTDQVSGYRLMGNASIQKDQHAFNSLSDKNSSSKPTNIRLNKRFQPEAIPTCAYTALPPLFIHTLVYLVSTPTEYLLISSILADSLRGPPSMG